MWLIFLLRVGERCYNGSREGFCWSLPQASCNPTRRHNSMRKPSVVNSAPHKRICAIPRKEKSSLSSRSNWMPFNTWKFNNWFFPLGKDWCKVSAWRYRAERCRHPHLIKQFVFIRNSNCSSWSPNLQLSNKLCLSKLVASSGIKNYRKSNLINIHMTPYNVNFHL